MKPSSDQATADLFASEGASAAQDPPVLECVTTAGTMSGFHPRPMPSLLLACPSSEGAHQRYRKPLWRAFERDDKP